MTIPRQVLYGVESFKAFAKGVTGRLNEGNYKQANSDFCNAFSKQAGVQDVIPLSRCRYGLYLALKTVISDQGNEVIMCPFTIFDMVNMVLLAGGKPIFIDSEPNTVDPSAEMVGAHIGENTAAVLITHYHIPNKAIVQIEELCRQQQVCLIEDCAIAIGEHVAHRPVGSFGDFSLFSFGLFKTIAAPYGGALYVKDRQQRRQVRNEVSQYPLARLKDLQPYLNRSLVIKFVTASLSFRFFAFPLFAFAQRHQLKAILSKLDNDPMPELQDKLPPQWQVKPSVFQLDSWRKQLGQLKLIVEHRTRIAQIYRDILRENQMIILPAIEPDDGIVGGYSLFTILVDADKREALITAVMNAGFDLTKHYYKNCANLTIFEHYQKPLPNIDRYFDSMLCLPTHLRITTKHAEKLARTIGDTIALL